MSCLSRRHFLRAVAGSTLSSAIVSKELLAGAWENQQDGTRRPNVIFIMTDDLGYGSLGCYGQTLIETPCIDKMAAEGIRFTDFYAANTVCVPSRCGLLTGLHPGHAPIRDNLLPHVDLALDNGGGYMGAYPRDLWPLTVTTLGQVPKRAGYETAQFGKLEVGIPMAPGEMGAHGWDYWIGFRETDDAAQYYPLSIWKNDKEVTFEANKPEEVRRSGIVGTRGVYSEDLFVDDLLRFIREHKDRRFFVYFPTQVPHGRSPRDGSQIQAPDVGPYAERPWTQLEKLYAAMITRFDGHVGRIVEQVQSLGLDRDTAIFVTSDNGDENSYYEYTDRFHPRNHAYDGSGGLHGKKRFLYEGGIRVPMIVRWPGHIGAGQTSDLPWAGWDVMVTIADLVGSKAPEHTDGISVLPTLLGNPGRQRRHDYLYWEYHQGKQQAVRLGRWKAVRFGGTKEPVELYDLRADVNERTNVADAHADIVQRMQAIMTDARAGSPYDKYWPFPDRRRYDIQRDKWIYDQLRDGIR